MDVLILYISKIGVRVRTDHLSEDEDTLWELGGGHIICVMVRVETRRYIPRAHYLSNGESRNMHADRACII
jgi:hypothetical protein